MSQTQGTHKRTRRTFNEFFHCQRNLLWTLIFGAWRAPWISNMNLVFPKCGVTHHLQEMIWIKMCSLLLPEKKCCCFTFSCRFLVVLAGIRYQGLIDETVTALSKLIPTDQHTSKYLFYSTQQFTDLLPVLTFSCTITVIQDYYWYFRSPHFWFILKIKFCLCLHPFDRRGFHTSLWTEYLKNALREFIQLWHECSLWLKDELIR